MNINIQIITSKTHTCFPDLVWSCNILLSDMEIRRAPDKRVSSDFFFLKVLVYRASKPIIFPLINRIHCDPPAHSLLLYFYLYHSPWSASNLALWR